jgi:uncharacterized protein (TIGR02145 family)
MKNLFRISEAILLIILISSCKKDKPTPPVITTTSVTEISYLTATSGGDVTNEGGAPIISKGVCWNTSASPTISNSKTIESGGSGVFTSNLTQLSPNTLYYVRSYATNSAGTGYGNQVSFTTRKLEVPDLTTKTVTEITKVSAASGGNVTEENGSSVTARGICWATSTNPTTSDNKTSDGTGTGAFTSSITGLLPGTTYYVRAYATNTTGTGYGNEISLTTNPDLSTLTTTAVSTITNISAASGGTISKDGGAGITVRGICWSKIQNPTTDNNKTTNGTGTGIFISSATGLKGSTTYYIRAYAINSVGTAYGNELSFTTLPPTTPIITSTPISSLKTNSVISGGTISNDGGADIIASGVCWDTGHNPTINNDKTTDISVGGSFVSNITNLIPNTTYYLRSYATNSVGTGYGEELVFKTYAALDADGNGYYSVIIGIQTWLTANLKTTKYSNGNLIGTTNPSTLDVSGESTPEYQWAPGNNESNVSTYGRLYSWYAVKDTRNVCPTDWHVPSDAEWTTLVNSTGGESVAGGKLKEIGLTHFESPNIGATDEYGFTVLPAGYRTGYGLFSGMTDSGNFWTTTENSATDAWNRGIFSGGIAVGHNYFVKSFGFSVRCIKD